MLCHAWATVTKSGVNGLGFLRRSRHATKRTVPVVGFSAALAVVAAAGVGVFIAAEPRYVALCSTDGGECATAALTSDGLASETPETAVVSLSSADEVS